MSIVAGTDVVVIGGGPAGSTAATFLADKRHGVTVFEKDEFPREHVGESLLPFCYPIFEELGVLQELSERFVRKPGVRFVDTDGTTQTTWCFGHVIKDPSYLSFHVLRGEFDQLLLDNARGHGATVREGTRVLRVDLDGPDGGVEVHVTGANGDVERYQARFLVDASGRDTFLASRMRAKKPYAKLDRAAISTHWAGATYTGGIQEGLLQIVYLGGDKQGWIWAIPVGTDRVSVGVVLNHAYLRTEKERLLSEGSGAWQLDLYRQELFTSSFIAEVLAGARIIMPLMFNGDYSYSVTKKYGPNFAMVGDASAFIDPIFATGVYLSMNSSRLVSDAVHTALRSGNGDAEAAMRSTYATIDGAYALVDRAIQMFYNPAAINFAQIGSAAELVHRLHEDAMAVGHYLLAGDFFANHERYNRFLDLLKDPQLLRLYRHTVDRPAESRSSSCDARPPEIFHPVLARHEERRQQALREVRSWTT